MSKNDLDTFTRYERELRKTEKKVAGEIDPGARAVVVAVCVLLAMVSLVLPHAGDATGLDVLMMTDKATAEHIKLPSEIFVYMLAIFGIGFSTLALITRRWVLAWIALAGTAVDAVAGMLAIWTRNTVGVDETASPSGAGAGLLLGWAVAIVLVFHWARVVWNRNSYHLALEQERRAEAANREAFGLSLQRPVAPSAKAARADEADSAEADSAENAHTQGDQTRGDQTPEGTASDD
ncbi:hypothetical protein ACK8HH_08010 [Gordonia sp. LUNF6]|uniref:Rv2732c family membrane protein n=1 Tax=Gordonia TaxID=2053 RepID=UPI001C92D23B|nr:hypothetical protein [Gordonia sihwensis]MBY4569745.1 hypothetical protein [Gordonia sihwensis]WFN94484.1 hypothetical protein P5P27_08065 [Gordonia sihwensis]